MRLGSFWIVLWVVLCLSCGDGGNEQRAPPGDEPPAQPVDGLPAGVPRSIEYSLGALQSLSDQDARRDLRDEISDREIEYTRYWLAKALKPGILAVLSMADFRCYSNVGAWKDDAIVAGWMSGSDELLVLDARLLIVVVRSTERKVEDVASCFERVVNYRNNSAAAGSTFCVEKEGSSAKSAAWGRVEVNRGRASGWFQPAIHWWRSGCETVFVFEKQMKQPPSKIPLLDFEPLLGGIPPEDSRAFLRFARSNRKELCAEYFRRIAPEPSEDGMTREAKGVPLGAE